MCGIIPDAHWALRRCSSSARARGMSKVASPIAMKAASQLHWCGYRCGAALIRVPVSLVRRTSRATSAIRSSLRCVIT